MSCSRLALAFLALLCTNALFVAAGGPTPWDSPNMAEAFMNNFMSGIASSGAFSGDQMGDMQDIAGTMQDSVNKMASTGRSSKSKLQAMNMAFASSMAEIAAAEAGGSSMAAKTSAITNALRGAFLQTTGVSNEQFINEIATLINLISQSNVNSVSASASSGGGGGGYGGPAYGPSSYGPSQGASSVSVSASAAGGGSGGQGPSGYPQQGPGGYGPSGPGASAAASAAGGQGPYGPGQQGPGAAGPNGPGQQVLHFFLSNKLETDFNLG
ncbi:hypothetical protein AVEN_265717-1 [Araneus ventricosus]|uniref:Spidroin N-terminal domain-containing protein n=1 Tax=Araneus ventricosus TaxID=182803 RepID=A0A4Y2VIT6_ARAVE|nr:hypothetical protein AVEN_265717-1 [Araneus ventricosus]